MTLIGYVFSKLGTAKDVLSSMSKKPRFRTPCDSQLVKESEKLSHSTSIVLFHHINVSVSEIEGVFVNRSTVFTSLSANVTNV